MPSPLMPNAEAANREIATMTLGLRTRVYSRAGNTFYRDNTYSGARGSLWETAPMLAALSDPGAYHLFKDDFDDLNVVATTGRWVVVKDGAVVGSVLDRAGGWAQIITDANDNDEFYLATIGEGWLFAAGKPMWFEARIELTEAATNASNIIVGATDANGADALLNNGAGPAASYSGAVWFKVDGSLAWQFETSNAGTQVTNATAGTMVSGTAYRLGFIFDPADGTTGSITPYLDGMAGTAHAITLASLTEMNLLIGVKTGGARAETLKFDFVQALQVR